MIFSRSVDHFLAVATEGSFKQAAKELRITQAALSISIRRLEKDLGARLFVRSNRGVSLSFQGRTAFDLLSTRGLRLLKDLRWKLIEDREQPVRMGVQAHLASQALTALLKSPSTKNIQGYFGYSKLILD